MPGTGVPSEWFYSTRSSGATASLVIPAAGPTISHVLTRLIASALVIAPPANVAFDGLLQVLDGATSIYLWRISVFCIGGQIATDGIDQDVVLIGTAGLSMTIQFTGSQPSTEERITVRGYDL